MSRFAFDGLSSGRAEGRGADLLTPGGQVFGLEWRSRLWIPMFQFEALDLSVKSGAQRVRAELPSLWSGWTLASWFSQPNLRLQGRSPADMLDTDLEAVAQAVRSRAPVHAVALAPARRVREVAAHV